MKIRYAAATAALCFTLSGCNSIRTVEPAAGTLATGQKVLVDDGTCAAGQVKEVTGSTPGVPRAKRCVPRPGGQTASGPAAASAGMERQAFAGTWSGNLASGKSIQLRIPESGTPTYRFDGQNVAVQSANMTGGALVMRVGRGYGTVTVAPSGNGLAYTYRDGGGTSRTTLSRS